MVEPQAPPLAWIPANFLALDAEQSCLDAARVVIIPVPYDSTASFRTGARYGPKAIIEASYGLEDYDWELDRDVSQVGIHTTPALEPHVGDPGIMAQNVRQAVAAYQRMGKITGVLGGDHSVTIGSAQACQSRSPAAFRAVPGRPLPTLRDEYMGTRYGHASGRPADSRVRPPWRWPASAVCPRRNATTIRENSIPAYCWPQDDPSYIQAVITSLGPEVYIKC